MMYKSTRAAEEICRKLVKCPRLDVRKELSVPKIKGIYLWRERRSGKIVYVGTTLGKEGLWERIVKQHLNPSYKKTRKEEKSVLRKAIVEERKISAGKECVEWIKKNLLLSFQPCKKVRKIIGSVAEKILIAEYRPRYNKEW